APAAHDHGSLPVGRVPVAGHQISVLLARDLPPMTSRIGQWAFPVAHAVEDVRRPFLHVAEDIEQAPPIRQFAAYRMLPASGVVAVPGDGIEVSVAGTFSQQALRGDVPRPERGACPGARGRFPLGVGGESIPRATVDTRSCT